jgi:phosphoglycerate dehydrogenase-like enzyme
MPTALLLSDFVERRHAPSIEAAAPELARAVLQPGGDVDGDLAEVEIAYFSGDLYPDRAADFWRPVLQLPRLRWLHTYSAGVDHWVFQKLLEKGVRITNSSGASAVPIAQTALLYILALSRDLRRFLSAQTRHAWEPRDIVDLQAQVLGVVGLGPIGLEVARLGRAFGMRVIGMRRAARGDEPCETWPLSRLQHLLEIADHLVLALPLTPDTRHLIDATALARMKPTATLVNVGRGELVDEAALGTALGERRLAGAGLDVFETEPLPPESPLWDLPNVLITPHSAGTNPGNDERATEIFVDNLGRWLRGQTLVNQIPSPAAATASESSAGRRPAREDR